MDHKGLDRHALTNYRPYGVATVVNNGEEAIRPSLV